MLEHFPNKHLATENIIQDDKLKSFLDKSPYDWGSVLIKFSTIEKETQMFIANKYIDKAHMRTIMGYSISELDQIENNNLQMSILEKYGTDYVDESEIDTNLTVLRGESSTIHNQSKYHIVMSIDYPLNYVFGVQENKFHKKNRTFIIFQAVGSLIAVVVLVRYYHGNWGWRGD